MPIIEYSIPLFFVLIGAELAYAQARGTRLLRLNDSITDISLGTLSFWIHTRSVGRLNSFTELVLNTPSHHRVHHGVNPKYQDRNYTGVLIVWDRLFGTFTPEEEEPVYGITHPPRGLDAVRLHAVRRDGRRRHQGADARVLADRARDRGDRLLPCAFVDQHQRLARRRTLVAAARTPGAVL